MDTSSHSICTVTIHILANTPGKALRGELSDVGKPEAAAGSCFLASSAYLSPGPTPEAAGI